MLSKGNRQIIHEPPHFLALVTQTPEQIVSDTTFDPASFTRGLELFGVSVQTCASPLVAAGFQVFVPGGIDGFSPAFAGLIGRLFRSYDYRDWGWAVLATCSQWVLPTQQMPVLSQWKQGDLNCGSVQFFLKCFC